MGSWKGRGNQYIQFVRVLYCKLPTNGKQLPAFPLEAVPGIEPGLRGGIYWLKAGVRVYDQNCHLKILMLQQSLPHIIMNKL